MDMFCIDTCFVEGHAKKGPKNRDYHNPISLVVWCLRFVPYSRPESLAFAVCLCRKGSLIVIQEGLSIIG